MIRFNSSKNINMIWESIKVHPLFDTTFSDPLSKEEWFSECLKEFKKHNEISNNLSETNMLVLKYMIDNLKGKIPNVSKKYHYEHINGIASREVNTIVGSNSDTMFLERQKEYDLMREEYTPPNINFTLDETDEPMTNMKEMVEKYKNERNNIIIPKNNTHKYYVNKNTPKVKIFQNNDAPPLTDFIEFIIDEPPNNITDDVSKYKSTKKVSFDSIEKTLLNKIQAVEDEIKKISNKLDSILTSHLPFYSQKNRLENEIINKDAILTTSIIDHINEEVIYQVVS
jgi:hypothetical protein